MRKWNTSCSWYRRLNNNKERNIKKKKSGSGKGIQAEKNLYLGVENADNSDLILNIKTNNEQEGIEAKGIEIYSGTIKIEAEGDGINVASSDNKCESETVRCSGDCKCYVKFIGGDLTLTSNEDGIDSNGDIFISGGNISIFAATSSADQPIDQDGELIITGGNIIAAGSTQMGGVSATTNNQTAKTYTGTINSGFTLVVSDNSNNNELASLTFPKEANYIYFSFPTAFTAKLNGNVMRFHFLNLVKIKILVLLVYKIIMALMAYLLIKKVKIMIIMAIYIYLNIYCNL